ncbi:hypothetical protein [Mycolicibacter minnesotensis]
MEDYSRLAQYWRQWAPSFAGRNASVSTADDGSRALFRTDDYSVELYREGDWWIMDTIDDRGQRKKGAGKFSSFDLVEKYLTWDWGTSAYPALSSGPLGPDLYRLGYAPGIKVTELDHGYEIESNANRAVLSWVNATIFSHLMDNSIDEMEKMIINSHTN